MRFIIILLFAFTLLNTQAQAPITGLWKIDSVKVGEEDRTPVARWIKLSGGGSQFSGNGWLQHSQGSWDYDTGTGYLTIVDDQTAEEENIPFLVNSGRKSMTWERREGNDLVVVYLSRTRELPMSTIDSLRGNWRSVEVNAGPEFRFAWDGRFTMEQDSESKNGTYRMHPHRPELELTWYGENCSREYYMVSITDKTLVMEPLDPDKELLILERGR